jgi:hypothetical protein
MFLGHPSEMVRRAALLTLAGPTARVQLEELLTTRRVHDVQILPGFWRTTEKLPVQQLQSLANTGDATIQAQARLLLVASGEPPAIEQLEREIQPIFGEQTKLFIASALAKSGRTGKEAVAFYRQTYVEVSARAASDTRPLASLYEVLRELPGDEISELRRQMRKEKGSKLFENSGDNTFGFDHVPMPRV